MSEGHPFRWSRGNAMKYQFRFLGCVLLALVLVGCHRSGGGTSRSSDFELKLYKVPVQQSAQIEGALGVLLAGNGKNNMGVTQPFPGTLMVLAPPSVQASVEGAISALKKQSAGSIGAEALRVNFWVVQAKAGAGEDAPTLAPLEATLKQVRGTLGQSHFVLEDAVSAEVEASSLQDATKGNGKLVTSRGHMFDFHATAGAGADITLRVDYANTTAAAASRTIPELKTTVAIDPGEYVVLAQGLPAESSSNGSDATLLNLLVVRVDSVTPPSH